MKIACVQSDKRGEIDRVLSDLADQLAANGQRLMGIVKDQSHASSFNNGCDMKVRVLPQGPVIQITQNLGPGSDACRLDPIALTEAVVCVENNPVAGADLFILNKFGPEEANGRGFTAAIGAAIEQGIPVLVGVGAANTAAFQSFAGGEAETLPAETDKLLAWCQTEADAP